MPTINNSRRKLICVSRPLSMKISGKNHICSVKTFSSRALSTRQKKEFIGKSSILAGVKVVCGLHLKVLHAKQP